MWDKNISYNVNHFITIVDHISIWYDNFTSIARPEAHYVAKDALKIIL